MWNVDCEEKESIGGNETDVKPLCDCINECDVAEFGTAISSGKMSAESILDDIPDSSDIPRHFVNATETRNRVDASVMMQTVRLIIDASEAHRHMRVFINMNFVDAGTSWTKDVSRLLENLGEMVQDHTDDSLALFRTLYSVYMAHVDYLVTTFATLLQECDVQVAQIHVITVGAKSRVT